jgi:hypothetical protein
MRRSATRILLLRQGIKEAREFIRLQESVVAVFGITADAHSGIAWITRHSLARPSIDEMSARAQLAAIGAPVLVIRGIKQRSVRDLQELLIA